MNMHFFVSLLRLYGNGNLVFGQFDQASPVFILVHEASAIHWEDLYTRAVLELDWVVGVN